MNHPTYSKLLTDRVAVALVGAGGSGSQMLTGLARLDCGLRSLNHPGLHVTVYDPDTVSEANVGRQLFSPSDIGHHKSNVLVHRLNCFFGLDWLSRPTLFPGNAKFGHGLTISCVDTKAARRDIGKELVNGRYWLDLGNDQYTGQVILGGHGLPTVLDRHPEIKRSNAKEDNTPSCSLAEAIEKQSLFINQAVSTWALHLLETLFRQGGINHCGYYINLSSGRVNPIVAPVTPKPKSKGKTLAEVLI